MTASAGGRELSQRLAKIETAISRRKTIQFSYYTMERDATMDRKVDPYHLVFRSGQFYLIGYAHERDAVRVFRLSRIQGKVSYASKAEHDFNPPGSFDRRDYASRADWQMGSKRGNGADLPPRPDRLAGRARLRRVRARSSRPTQRRREARQGLGLRDRVLLVPPARRLAARLAPERQRDRARPSSATEAEERREHAAQPPLQRLQDRQAGRLARRSPTPSAAAAPTARPRP